MSDADDTDISFLRKSNPGRQSLNQHVDETVQVSFWTALRTPKSSCSSPEALSARSVTLLFAPLND